MLLHHSDAGLWLLVSSIQSAKITELTAAACSNVGLFLPRFTDTLDATLAAGLLSAFNFSQVIAQILWGYLTDVSRTLARLASSI